MTMNIVLLVRTKEFLCVCNAAIDYDLLAEHGLGSFVAATCTHMT